MIGLEDVYAILIALFLFIILKVIEGFTGDSKKLDQKSKLYKVEAERIRTKEIKRLKKQRTKKEIINLDELNWQQFEILIGEYFKKVGARVINTPFSNDVGKDIVVFFKNEKLVIECKKYTTNKIGRPDIQKFHSATINESADAGIFVTTTSFTKQAIEYANKHGIILWDRTILESKLGSVSLMDNRSEEIVFDVICEYCGKKVMCSLTRTELKCKKGHLVESNIIEENFI